MGCRISRLMLTPRISADTVGALEQLRERSLLRLMQLMLVVTKVTADGGCG